MLIFFFTKFSVVVTLPEVIYDPVTDTQLTNENKRTEMKIKDIPVTGTYALFEK